VVLGLISVFLFAQADPAAKPMSFQEYHRSLKGDFALGEGVALIGPQAEDCVKFEPTGLRLVLPQGWKGERSNTGINFRVLMKGDFEITVHFEILHEPKPAEAGKVQTRFTLGARLDRPGLHVVTISRRVQMVGGTQWLVWMSQRDDPAEKRRTQGKGFRSAAKTGRLRLARTGSTISYLASDGLQGDFTLLEQYPFGADDVNELHLAGSTGSPQASLDVRLTDLHLRAESLPNQALAPDPAEVEPERNYLFVVSLLLGAVGTLFVLALGVWLLTRHRPRGSTAALPVRRLTFTCPGCGKSITAREELAGKKGKCRHCGQAVLIPSGESESRPLREETS
jgi:hypothetical protein